nr:MAG TPA: hypothetical protein [Caudoviricetes sp.]
MNKFLVYLNFTLIIIGYIFSLSLFFYMLYWTIIFTVNLF